MLGAGRASLYGGAAFHRACNDDCTACLSGPWTVDDYPPFPKTNCPDWVCVDGRVVEGPID